MLKFLIIVDFKGLQLGQIQSVRTHVCVVPLTGILGEDFPRFIYPLLSTTHSSVAKTYIGNFKDGALLLNLNEKQQNGLIA